MPVHLTEGAVRAFVGARCALERETCRWGRNKSHACAPLHNFQASAPPIACPKSCQQPLYYGMRTFSQVHELTLLGARRSPSGKRICGRYCLGKAACRLLYYTTLVFHNIRFACVASALHCLRFATQCLRPWLESWAGLVLANLCDGCCSGPCLWSPSSCLASGANRREPPLECITGSMV